MRKLLTATALAALLIAVPAQATCKAGRKKVEARAGATRVISVWHPSRANPRLRYYSQIGRRGKYFFLENDYAECVNAGRRDAFVDPVYGGPILYRLSASLLAFASESGGEGGIDSARVKLFDVRRRKLVYSSDAAMGQTSDAYRVIGLTLQAGGALTWTIKDSGSGQTKEYSRP